MREELLNKIRIIAGSENLKENESMKLHTTFKVGGVCDYFITPETKEAMIEVLQLMERVGEDYFLLGNGSNILVREKGIRGFVISTERVKNITVDKNTVRALCGNSLSEVAHAALGENLKGFEFASGIPGSVGGAIFMNAGAYGREIKDCLIEALVWDKKEGARVLSAESLELSYRTSLLQKKDMIALEGVFALEAGNKKEIKDEMARLNNARREKQPLEYASAGSTFKRPKGYFAGKLIDDAGLRGYKIGGAQVSEKHCGFIINTGSATSEDILILIDFVKQEVYNKFKVSLETEVKIIGEE